MPQDGYAVHVPAGKTVKVKGKVYPTFTPTLYLKIEGVLAFENSGKLELSSASTVELTTAGASITSNKSASEIISIGGVIKFNGHSNGVITGPTFASSSTGSAPNGFILGVLPIKLKSFTAQAQKHQIFLKWSTAEELNASRFEVERSIDGRSWNTLEIVGVKGFAVDYSALDAAPVRGENFYRLKMVDLDGKTEFSNVLKINTYKNQSVHFGPNPASGFVSITLSGVNSVPLLVQLIGAKGQVVREATHKPNQSNFFTFSLQGVAKGLYTLVIHNGEAAPETAQLVVQ